MGGEFTETWNLKFYNGRDMLMSFSVGPRDWAVIEDQRSDDTIKSSALAALRTMFPSLPTPTQMHVHRWGTDELASCTWSSWYVGSTPTDRKQFLKGAGSGRLLFAGEHTTKHAPGTTHGAWETGQSAAAAITAHEALPDDMRTAIDVAGLREGLHKHSTDHVCKGRILRSRRKECSRQSMSTITEHVNNRLSWATVMQAHSQTIKRHHGQAALQGKAWRKAVYEYVYS